MRKNLSESQEIDLGNVVFDPYRLDLQSSRQVEKNTDIEEKIYDVLSDYVSGVNKKIPQDIVVKLKLLMKSNVYSDYFRPVSGDMLVYRGLTDITEEKLASLIGRDNLSEQGSMSYNGTIYPRNGTTVMSFSKSLTAVLDYFSLSLYGGYTVIFTAKASENHDVFLDFSKGIYSTEPMDGLDYEKEVLALGKVKLSNIWWKMNE